MIRYFKPYDVFISYVVEDREVVEKIVEGLVSNGVKVWYAKEELEAGEEIRPLINKGLKNSRYGVAVITPLYRSAWAFGEFFVLKEKGKKLIPVIHNFTWEEVIHEHPEIVHWYCLKTEEGIEKTVVEVARQIEKKSDWYYKIARFLWSLSKGKSKELVTVISVLAIVLLGSWFTWNIFRYPSDKHVENVIGQRIEKMAGLVQTELQQEIVQNNAGISSLSEIRQSEQLLYKLNEASYYRNKYDFFDGKEHISSLAGLKREKIVSSDGTPQMPYGLSDYSSYFCRLGQNNKLRYSFVNQLPVSFEVIDSRLKGDVCEIDIRYTNALRYAVVTVEFDSTIDTKERIVQFWGLKPNETLVFEKDSEGWSLLSVN